MALIAASSGTSDFKPVPAGMYMARCYRVIDLGTQRGEWKGKEKWSRKVLIQWELYGEAEDGTPLILDDGRPMSVSKRYTLSLGDNAQLRADLKSWRGRDFSPDELAGFDISALLGVGCMLNIAHDTKDGKTYTNVASVTPIPKVMRDAFPKAVNPQMIFDVSEPNMEFFGGFSERLQETIKGCKEWQKVSTSRAATETASHSAAPFEDEELSDIPF